MAETEAYDFEDGNGFTVVNFNPAIADAQWGEIEQVGTELKERLSQLEAPIFLVDLTRLQFMGSSVVALIVKLWKAVNELQGGLVVINSSSVIYEVLDIAGLTRLWTIVETREEAEVVITKPPFRPPSMAPTYLLAVFGWVVAAGASGLIAAQQKQLFEIDATVGKAVVLACGGLAAITGITSTIRERGFWQVLGVLLVFVAGTLVAAGVLL
jgi:anti-anti-sigma factor